MVGNRFFEPKEKTNFRRIWDRVSTLELGNIESYIRGAYIAHLNLFANDNYKKEPLFDETRVKYIEEDYKPLFDYIDELKSRTIDSTEKQIDLDRDLICLRDLIAADMHQAYECDGYGRTRYEDQKILDYFLNRPKMSDRALVEYPRIIWATKWLDEKENKKFYKLSQKILSIEE